MSTCMIYTPLDSWHSLLSFDILGVKIASHGTEKCLIENNPIHLPVCGESSFLTLYCTLRYSHIPTLKGVISISMTYRLTSDKAICVPCWRFASCKQQTFKYSNRNSECGKTSFLHLKCKAGSDDSSQSGKWTWLFSIKISLLPVTQF